MPFHQSLQRRIEDKTARLVIVGLGYVGLPVSVEPLWGALHPQGSLAAGLWRQRHGDGQVDTGSSLGQRLTVGTARSLTPFARQIASGSYVCGFHKTDVPRRYSMGESRGFAE